MAKTTRYDVQMIRDFLDHLEWDVRIAEVAAKSKGKLNKPELVEQLMKYSKKYGCMTLPVRQIAPVGCTPEQVENVKERLYEVHAEVYGKWLTHLEGLRGLFANALNTATFPATGGKVPSIVIRASDFFESTQDKGGADSE